MTPESDKPPPMAVAMQWVSKITTVALEMVLPGLGGIWLDKQAGTHFLALVGFGLGMALGIWHLLQMTKSGPGNRRQPPTDKGAGS